MNARKFLFISVLFFIISLNSIPGAEAAVHIVNTCNQSDVQDAIDSANPGDTIQVPVGNCVWNNHLALTKAISVIGAGIGKTIINNEYAPSLSGGTLDPLKHLISIIPAQPETNPKIRLSGFTFNFGTSSYGIFYKNPSLTYDCTNVRLDHLELSSSRSTGAYILNRYGLAHGVMDNCIIKGGMGNGGYSDLWSTNGYEFGTNSNFYVEDCEWSPYSNITPVGASTSGAVRYAFRYNTIIIPTDRLVSPLFDQHGNQYDQQASAFGAELYGNTINTDGNSWTTMFFDQRGGKSLVFDNKATWSTGGGIQSRIREEHLDTDGAGEPINLINGQPQHISDTYYWGNAKNGDALIPSLSDELGIGIPEEDVHVWLGKNNFDGTSGVGCGTLAEMNVITTCNEGVGFWATDQSCSDLTGMIGANPTEPIDGTLYKCVSGNWEAYYTPLTYPHPLIDTICGDGILEGNEECDDGNTISGDGCSDACTNEPVCGNDLIETGEICDGLDLDDFNCGSFGYASGTLICDSDCNGFDMSNCVGEGDIIHIVNLSEQPSCEYEDANRIIGNANPGDTIIFPTKSCTWSSAVRVDKPLIIDGNGSTLTAGATLPNGFFHIAFSDTPSLMRLTNFTFNRQSYTAGRTLHIDGNIPNLRIDHNKFHYGVYQIEIYAQKGLIDNNEFYNGRTFVQFNGRSRPEQDDAWKDLSMGTVNAIFFENNLIVCDANDVEGVCATGNSVDASAGARVVARYNEWDYDDHVLSSQVAIIGFHGSAAGGCPYGYWQSSTTDCRRSPTCIEIYENNMHGYRMDFMFTQRGGTALIFNNTHNDDYGGYSRIKLREEEGYESQWTPNRVEWPAEDQVHNTFIWGNILDGEVQTDTRVEVETDSSVFIKKDRDYFLHEPQATGGRENFYTNSDCIVNDNPHTCCSGPATGNCLNGASDTYPTDETIYQNYGTMYFEPDGPNAYYGYRPYTYPHPLRLLETQTIEYHESDTNHDGCIETDEMIAFLNRWKISSSDVGMIELMESISLWKGGTEC